MRNYLTFRYNQPHASTTLKKLFPVDALLEGKLHVNTSNHIINFKNDQIEKEFMH